MGRTTSPVPTREGRLPDIFDHGGITADEARGHPILDRSDDGTGGVVIVRRTDAVETRLVGEDLDDHPSGRDPCADALDAGDSCHWAPLSRVMHVRVPLRRRGKQV